MAAIVLDNSILLSALRSRNEKFRNILLSGEYTFYAPNFLIVELFKHRARITKNAAGTEAELIEYMEVVMSPGRFISDTILPVGTLMKAYQLCSGIDEKDFLYIALSLEF